MITPLKLDHVLGKKVRVYRNLHNGLYSIQHYVKYKGWRVIGHTETIMLQNVEFLVNEKARIRVLTERRKNVHAFVTGYVVATISPFEKVLVTYNPHKLPYFHTKHDHTPVYNTNYLWIIGSHLFADLTSLNSRSNLITNITK